MEIQILLCASWMLPGWLQRCFDWWQCPNSLRHKALCRRACHSRCRGFSPLHDCSPDTSAIPACLLDNGFDDFDSGFCFAISLAMMWTASDMSKSHSFVAKIANSADGSTFAVLISCGAVPWGSWGLLWRSPLKACGQSVLVRFVAQGCTGQNAQLQYIPEALLFDLCIAAFSDCKCSWRISDSWLPFLRDHGT